MREGDAIPFDMDAARRIARDPAMDREEVARREAGIYDDTPAPHPVFERRPEPEPKRESNPRRQPEAKPEPSSDSRPRRRRGGGRRRGSPVTEREPIETTDVPEVEEEERIAWWDEIEDELDPDLEDSFDEDQEDSDEDDFEDEPGEYEPAEVEAEFEEPEPAPEPEPEPEVDGFDLGIFEEEEEEAPAAEPPTPVVAATEVEATAATRAPAAGPPAPPAEAPKSEPANVAARFIRDIWTNAVRKRPERRPEFKTTSDLGLAPLYAPDEQLAGKFEREVGNPGEFPFTRGVQPTMYRGRLWTMRQYAGFGSARATNERFRYLLAQGQTGLSVAFDLPTQIGYDSDDPAAEGEVGKVGVPINSLKDMELLLADIPLDQVSLSMTINSSALVLLLMVVAVAKKQGIPIDKLRGTVQNDMLKEFAARNTYRFPLDAHMRLVTDIFRYSSENLPLWNMISISGYHIREAGSTAVQEVAFTLANAIAYVERAVKTGLAVDDFAPRLSFFFAAHNHLFEEVAKFRAARRLWAKIMKDRFGAKNPKSMMLRFHTQTGGSTLTANQPRNNVVRVAMQALAGVLGGTQSLHTNSWDEALSLPSEEAVLTALRTQQIIAHESGVTDVVDPLGGSPLVEELTDSIEAGAAAYIARIDELGGAEAAIKTGWMTGEIERAAYEAQKAIDHGDQIVVGVNEFVLENEAEPEIFPVDEAQAREVLADLAALKAERSPGKVESALAALEISAAWGDADLPELVLACVEAYCTLGEICESLGSVLAADGD